MAGYSIAVQEENKHKIEEEQGIAYRGSFTVPPVGAIIISSSAKPKIDRRTGKPKMLVGDCTVEAVGHTTLEYYRQSFEHLLDHYLFMKNVPEAERISGISPVFKQSKGWDTAVDNKEREVY